MSVNNPQRCYIVLSTSGELYAAHLTIEDVYTPVYSRDVDCLPSFIAELPLGRFREVEVHLRVVDKASLADTPAPPDSWRSFRQALLESDAEAFTLLSAARQLMEWQREHRYCGLCGAKTQLVHLPGDRFLQCTGCQHPWYPRISPCMICIIIKGEYLLLAKHKRGGAGFYSALAGFVEPGESIEQSVHREVMEEVSLQVKNLEYIGSQAWSFPHQLMIGFLCHYAGGEISLCDDEIASANWFHYSKLPPVPPIQSLSGQLIQAAVARLQGRAG